MDDLDLLELEVRTIWGFDENGLGDGTVQVTALTYDGRTRLLPGASAIGPDDAISATVCRSWLLGPSRTQPSPTGLRLTSEPGTARPPARWSGQEWTNLLAGQHGPFVAAVAADRVVSLAHCARLTDAAAEVGVQTEEDWTGRGLATACVRAWVAAMPHDRTLFYSAMEDNPASHRVAAACGARPLGRLVRVGPMSPDPPDATLLRTSQRVHRTPREGRTPGCRGS